MRTNPCLMAGPVTRLQQTGDDSGLGFVQFLPLIAAAVSAGGGMIAARKAAKAADAARRKQAADDAAYQAREHAAALDLAKLQGPGAALVTLPGVGPVDGKTLALVGGGLLVVFFMARR